MYYVHECVVSSAAAFQSALTPHYHLRFTVQSLGSVSVGCIRVFGHVVVMLEQQCLPGWFHYPVNCSSTLLHSCLCQSLAAISPLLLFLNDVKLELYELG